MIFLYVLTVHQDWEHQDVNAVKPWWKDPKNLRLIGACNALGLFLMVAFLLWVKGID